MFFCAHAYWQIFGIVFATVNLNFNQEHIDNYTDFVFLVFYCICTSYYGLFVRWSSEVQGNKN